ncbi:MAG: hypothetical protein LQ348_003997 [Seirophora lacunosa]|nr:MAG: hypothetical protein LQ348_003997 [Seirophora lacunosa]
MELLVGLKSVRPIVRGQACQLNIILFHMYRRRALSRTGNLWDLFAPLWIPDHIIVSGNPMDVIVYRLSPNRKGNHLPEVPGLVVESIPPEPGETVQEVDAQGDLYYQE